MNFKTFQPSERALGEISQQLSATFDGVVESIGAVRRSAGEFATNIDLLQSIDASDDHRDEHEMASFAAFSEHAERAAAAAEMAASELDERSFQAGLRALLVILAELKRNTVELAAISSLTKIAKTESPAVAERLSVFTETLDKRFRDLRNSTSEAAVLVDAIRVESGEARAGLTSIAAELRRIAHQAGSDADELWTLKQAHLAQMDKMASDSRNLGNQVQSAVARVIACLQFPDAFAQRIEHVRTMLSALDDGRPAEEVGVIAELAAAQLDAMAEALIDATDNAIAALRAIPVIGDHGPGEILGDVDGDVSSAWMEAERRADETMIRTVAASRNRLDAAVAQISRIVSEVDTARDLLEESRRQNKELNISVHNASIVASRFSSGASALHVLAEAVKAVVGQVSCGVGRIFEELGRIRRSSLALQQTPLATELDTLGRIQELTALKANDDTVRFARAREAREQLARSAEKLSAAASDGQRKFEAARSHSASLNSIAAELRDGFAHPDAAQGNVDLAWVEALYTMNEERDVHDEAVARLGLAAGRVATGASAPKVAADPADAEAELDDFLL